MKKLAMVLLCSALLAACGKSGGGEFVGKWVNVKRAKNTLEIVANGDNYMLKETSPSFIDGKPETKSHPATFKDGMLLIQSGFGPVTLAVDKSTGHLTGGNAEYERVKE